MGRADNDQGVDRLRKALQPKVTAERPPQVKLTRVRVPGVDVQALADSLCRWYKTQNLETTSAATASGLTVQCRTREAWKRVLGMGAALTTVLRADGADLLVEVGAAQWIGKGLAGGASLVAAAAIPIAPVVWVTIGIGAWRQYRLPQQTIDFLRAAASDHQRTGPPVAPRPQPVPSGLGYTPQVSSAPAGPIPVPYPSYAPPAGHRVVNVSTATVEELAAVPGLGPRPAGIVVADRQRRGGYASLAEVQRVLADHVQPHVFRRLRPLLTVRAPASGLAGASPNRFGDEDRRDIG